MGQLHPVISTPIPPNVFIIASCNPHRGDVLTIMHEKNPDSWLKGSYYVRQLHPTLEHLKWDYGSLDRQQEEEYVYAKMKMLSQQSPRTEGVYCTTALGFQPMSPDDVSSLTVLIVQSQENMRAYAEEQLFLLNFSRERAQLCAKSSVSQRDIQRVFRFYQWLMKTYAKLEPRKEEPELQHRRAVMVSLGLVYFIRLNSNYRLKYSDYLDTYSQKNGELTFSQAFEDELRWYSDRVQLPPNIAKTIALKENVFATIACTMTHTPLIIVGDPGSSKTLSFNIVTANLKGKQSKIDIFRHTDIFQSLDPHFHQCSRRTTSTEVEKTFKKAINRQHSLAKSRLPIFCVVFMDEAGLPEEKFESLKVLHYYLDRQEVSFVAISNHVLDASKTNRAVSLFRPKPTDTELFELAKVSIVQAKHITCSQYEKDLPTPKVPILQEEHINPSQDEKDLLHHFCSSYRAVIRHQTLFGLRDFIHFVTYIRCNRKHDLNAQLILKALERNFNGSKRFADIYEFFFTEIPGVSVEGIQHRSILDILKDWKKDYLSSTGDDIHKAIQSEVRYKLIIDPSEDDSLVRLLFTYGVLQRENTRLYICSDFPGDNQLRVNTVVQIMHSVAVGHTILMCQTDEIHEGFYDLFNQRFHSIVDPIRGTSYYTNITIGAHSKPCRVNPNFQCVVVIKESELALTPPPFLNRFEKYYLTHKNLLETVLEKMPYNLRILLDAAHSKVADFISCVKQPNLYGCTENTLDSLLLALLPPTDHKYIPLPNQQNYENIDQSEDICMFLLKILIKMLRNNAGFQIPPLLASEIEEDADHIFKVVLETSDFDGALGEIRHDNVAALINETLNILHNGPQPTNEETQLNVYTDSLLVIAILMQWFVNYLCKKLMQLVPPEALPVHCSGIPTVYIRNYLEFQEHFSLKELVKSQLNSLEKNNWDMSVCPTKLLCFTRSSPLIHQLPADYPATVITTTLMINDDFVRKHIFTELEHLMICKVTLGHSQGQLEKLLVGFTTSNCQVLLLVVNMQEITIRMVNHLRIMIEEAENEMKTDIKRKLFVLLLHFPPMMFFNPCYPSLFLQGWSHHYLDTIACGTLTTDGIKSVVDIRKCFYHCCFPDSISGSKEEEDQMLDALNRLLHEAVPIIASRVAFTCKGTDTITTVMNASKRTELLQKLLFDDTSKQKVSIGQIGQVLTAKFCKYWTPWLMVKQIDQVSRSMYAQDSTLNITDSIQSIVRSAFFDFLIYMFTRISEDRNIDIFLQSKKDGTRALQQLFLDLLREINVPELARLKNISATIRPQQIHRKTIPRFPFFKCVCDILEKAIDESAETVNQMSIIAQLKDAKPVTSFCLTQKISKQQMEKLYIEVVKIKIKDNLSSCLGVTVNSLAIDNEDGDTIWRRYFDDFVHYKLHLGSKPPAPTMEIINTISPLESTGDALTRIVSLHVHFHVHLLILTKVTRILKPMSMVENVSASKTDSAVPLTTAAPLMQGVKLSTKMPPTLGNHVIMMLFASISNMDTAASEHLQSWYRSYGDIISTPAMIENIMSNPATLPEAQLNIMHTTYLVMLCCLDSSSQRGHQVFNLLCSKHCGQDSQCILLSDMMDAGLKSLELTMRSLNIQSREGYCLRSFMEGLFSFFFSKHRVSFNEEDCKYFFEIANQQFYFGTTSIQNVALVEESTRLCHGISINMFKLFLTRILGEPEHSQIGEAEGCNVFGLNYKHHETIGRVIASQSDHGSPGPYIPTFYQLNEKIHIDFSPESFKNALMQQPLAHLYFLTVFEHIQNRSYDPTGLVLLARKIDKFLQKDSTSKAERIVLFIEKQAVVQMLIFQVSTYFDPKEPSRLHSLFNTHLNERVNPCFVEESMGGSSTVVSWHALTLAMHLQKQLKNPWELIRLLRDDNSTLVKDISIVKPLQSLIQPLDQPQGEPHLFPFVKDRSSDSELADFYHEVCQAMVNVSKRETSQEDVDALIKLVTESYNSEHKTMKFTTSRGNHLMIDKRKAFRMLLWLCVYNEFYIQKIHSRTLADTISKDLRGVLEPEFINLLKSFIFPDYMILCDEAVPPLDENAPKFTLTENLQFVPFSQGEHELAEPIWELFKPQDKSKRDFLDLEICRSMANMVAIVLACEPQSNHLWYHLFAADGLSESHMTGFMYKDKISENLLYDCGVELSSDGMYGRPDYIPHATRGTLSLHSLQFLLWANFSAFCMALMTQPDAQKKISGPIISPWQPVRHYCVGQLRNAWLHMGNQLSLSPEEQSFFVMQCMERLLEVSISQPQLLQKGRFETLEELNSYERMWHSQIFDFSLENIHSKFAKHRQLQLYESELFQNIRCLETYYPHFPAEFDEFSQTLLSSVDITSPQNELYVLSAFTLEYYRLKAAGALLPNLLDLYYWIHNELAYLVTQEEAKNHTIEEVIKKGNEMNAGADLIQLYAGVRDGYNSYMEVIGHSIGAGACANVQRKGRLNEIKDSTELIHFLSVESDDEQWEGSDLLYLVIDDIITFHNGFLQKVVRAVTSSEHSGLRKYFPEKLDDYVYPTEVNEDIMVIPGKTPKAFEVEEQLQLIRSRYLQPTERETEGCLFDLHRLQIDVIQTYIAGKPPIHQGPENIRISFKFKTQRPNTFDLEGADLDLSAISCGIKQEFMLQLEEKDASELECEFHSADYDTLAEVVRGLRVATEHLKSDHEYLSTGDEVQSKKLPEFLLMVFRKPTILEDIGIRHLSPSQLACLQALRLPYLYSTLELFVNWVKDGMYDFHELPLVMKRHLEPKDKEILDTFDKRYKGTGILLLQEIQKLLVHSQLYLKKTIAENMQKQITVFLSDKYGEIENAELIPDTVLCQHYVALRVMIRRTMAGLQGDVAAMVCKQEDPKHRWVELVEDLWKKEEKLKHLWDIAKPFNRLFEFDPAAGKYGLYGYQDGVEVEEIKSLVLSAEKEKKEEEEKEPEPKTPVNPVTKEQLEEIAEMLSVDDVTVFLEKWKLEKYTEIFIERDIDGVFLFSLTKEALKEIGITSDFDRTKILTKFKQHLQKLRQ